jgi:predicted SprT family Zn-dependent metalloprotease
VWGIPHLQENVIVQFSQRMIRGLGRYYPERRLIRLSARLLNGPGDILEEALCHELAHLAV